MTFKMRPKAQYDLGSKRGRGWSPKKGFSIFKGKEEIKWDLV